MRRFFASLFGQVVAALVVGIVLGVLVPQFAVGLKPLGDVFIKLIKCVVAPLVFAVVVNGIVGAGDLKKVGRVGLKSLIYFEAVTTIALALGIVLAYVFQLRNALTGRSPMPGNLPDLDVPAELDPQQSAKLKAKLAQEESPEIDV